MEKFAEEAFEKDSRIRYVGVIGDGFHVLCSKMRKGVESIATAEEERNFVQIMPPIIVEAAAKLDPVLGKLDNVTVRYEKVLLVFFRCKNLTIVLSFNPNVSTPFISSLSETIIGICSRHLED